MRVEDTTQDARQDRSTEPGRRWTGVAAILLGFGAAGIAVLGPLWIEAIDYHVSGGALGQIAGGDAAALLLVAPTAIVAGILMWRSHPAGPVLASGPAVYALYTYVQLAVGADFDRYRGDSERFFPVFVGLFILAGAIAVRTWADMDAIRLPATNRRTDRFLGILLMTVAAFLVFGLHLPGLVDALAPQPTSPEYLADPNVFWLVKFMDLGIVVPALMAVGVGILRGAAWAHKAKYAAVGWFALLGSSVAGMAVVMQLTDDPAGSTANTLAFGAFAAFGLAVAVVVYRPLFTR